MISEKGWRIITIAVLTVLLIISDWYFTTVFIPVFILSGFVSVFFLLILDRYYKDMREEKDETLSVGFLAFGLAAKVFLNHDHFIAALFTLIAASIAMNWLFWIFRMDEKKEN